MTKKTEYQHTDIRSDSILSFIVSKIYYRLSEDNTDSHQEKGMKQVLMSIIYLNAKVIGNMFKRKFIANERRKALKRFNIVKHRLITCEQQSGVLSLGYLLNVFVYPKLA
jgi:hypothetical protein